MSKLFGRIWVILLFCTSSAWAGQAPPLAGSTVVSYVTFALESSKNSLLNSKGSHTCHYPIKTLVGHSFSGQGNSMAEAQIVTGALCIQEQCRTNREWIKSAIPDIKGNPERLRQGLEFDGLSERAIEERLDVFRGSSVAELLEIIDNSNVSCDLSSDKKIKRNFTTAAIHFMMCFRVPMICGENGSTPSVSKRVDSKSYQGYHEEVDDEYSILNEQN